MSDATIKPYYCAGDHYLVPGEDDVRVPQRLVGFRGPCGARCSNFDDCPGMLLFESGASYCPTPQEGFSAKPFKHAPLTPAWRALQMFARLLNDPSKRKGTVELWDGRVVHFRVEAKQD
jgi:hypothetical protein